MKARSKKVEANKRAAAGDLIARAKRFSPDTYKRPIEREEELRELIAERCRERPLILDAGCGTGESSLELAKLNPEAFVLGADKSASRIERKNAFKKDLPNNLLLLRADMQSVWPLLLKMQNDGEVRVSKQYILYPNPWPKMKGLKRRWYANPMLAFIRALNAPVEARSNWRGYLEDFEIVWKGLGQGRSELEEFAPEKYMSAFEKKYALSGQKLYKLRLTKPDAGEV